MNSSDSVDDSCPVAVLPAGSSSTGQLETHVGINSSVTTVVGSGVGQTLMNSTDSVEDASPVDVLPAAPTSPDQVIPNIPFNSSGTAVVGSIVGQTLMNLVPSSPLSFSDYIRSPDYYPDDNGIPQNNTVPTEDVTRHSPTSTDTSTTPSSPLK